MCSSDLFFDTVSSTLGKESASKLLKLAEIVNPGRNQDKAHLVTLEFEEIKKDFDKWSREVAKLRKQTGQSILEVVAVETQETRFSAEAYRKFLNISSELASKEGDVVIRIVKPGQSDLNQRVANASNIHMKLKTIDGAAIVYCERPLTNVYGLELDETGQKVNLVPIV